MKKIIISLTLIFVYSGIIAQDTVTVKSVIKSVIVYRKGAQVTHNAEKVLKPGKTILVFEDLSTKLDKSTIRVKPDNDLTIVSVSHRFNYLNKTKSVGKIKELEDKIASLKDSIQMQNRIIEVLLYEKKLILSNMAIGGTQNGVNIEDLMDLTDFYREKLNEIEIKRMIANNKTRDFRKEAGLMSLQLNEWNIKKDQTTSEIIVVVTSTKEYKIKFDLSYYISDAGWDPYYDVRVKDSNSKVLFNYKAYVHQNTDYDWKNVKLTLSTSNPEVSGQLPELEPYKLSNNYTNYSYNTNNNNKTISYKSMRGRVTDEEGYPLPGVSIIEKGTTYGTMTDFDGYFTLETENQNAVIVTAYIGMKSSEMPFRAGDVNIVLQPDVEIEEVVVTALGISRDQKSLGYSSTTISGDDITGFKSLGGNTPGVNIVRNKKKEIEKSETGVDFGNSANEIPKPDVTTFYDFEIPFPYTIPSDNKNYDISIKDVEFEANYEYTSVPKLEEKVFLTALITSWSKENLLSGEANIFFKDTYTGVTKLNLENFSDTLKISLGIDKDIQIKRESITEFNSSKILSGDYKVDRAWEISIKNNKPFAITLNIEDQIPISQDSKIKVENVDDSEADYNEKSGKLIWKLKMEPGTQKKISIKYSVKYPSEYRNVKVY